MNPLGTVKNATAEALRTSELRYRRLFESAKDGILILDAETGMIVDANPFLVELLGLSHEAFLGRKIWEIGFFRDIAANEDKFAELQAKDYVRYENLPLETADGRRIDVEFVSNVYLVSGRRVIQCNIRDITDRKRIEAALRQEQIMMLALMESLPDHIYFKDAASRFLRVNPAMARSFGLGAPAQLVGKSDADFFSAEHARRALADEQTIMRSGRPMLGVEERETWPDGHESWVVTSKLPLRDGAGCVIGTCGISRDITREVALEEQNRQAAKMEGVGQLAGGVAHDFNNKLQIILGCAEMILNVLAADHPVRGDVEEIQDAARRSADLTRQLLAFSRKQAIAPVVLDMNAAIVGSLKLLGRLVGANIRLHVEVPQGLWCVYMDPGQLDQVLANLVVNARDAIAGTGLVSIGADNRTLGEADCRNRADFVPPGDYVVLTVRDDGAGMSPEIQAHIFEPFFTTKGVGKGTGLGLATVYGIAKQNHGAVTVRSAPGQGATFSIYLPCHSRAAIDPAEKALESAPTGTETILLAEDEANLLNLVRRTLTQQGYRVLSAPSPAEALRLCAQYAGPIHLLLTDVVMPDLGGQAMAERMRKLRPDLRVLYMSGYAAEFLEQQGHLPDGLPLLQKPFTHAALAQRVRAALDAAPELSEHSP